MKKKERKSGQGERGLKLVIACAFALGSILLVVWLWTEYGKANTLLVNLY
jgi:hypothetical protein